MMRFDPETQTIWLPRADAIIEADLDRRFERLPGQLRWRLTQPSMLQKASSLLGAITSGIISDEEAGVRLASCLKCNALVTEGEDKYCGACGCGRWLLAKLDGPVPKLKWRGTVCPLKRW